MSAPIISILIPVYNVATYLPDLFDMLAHQPHHDKFEVVFVDDGSSDGSEVLLDDFCAGKVINARVIHTQNSGVSAARNRGIEASDGEYIAFIDADDAISPDYIDTLIKNAVRNLTVFRHSRSVRGDVTFDRGSGGKMLSHQELLSAFLQNPTRFGVYDLLVNRSVIDTLALRFPEGLRYYEDYAFLMRLFWNTTEAYMPDDCVYCYRAAPGSAMSVFSDERMHALKVFEDDIADYVDETYRRRFASRIAWSVMWQACVSMNRSEALAFGKKWDMPTYMRNLKGSGDARVTISAFVYRFFPDLHYYIMRYLGSRRTLISKG